MRTTLVFLLLLVTISSCLISKNSKTQKENEFDESEENEFITYLKAVANDDRYKEIAKQVSRVIEKDEMDLESVVIEKHKMAEMLKQREDEIREEVIRNRTLTGRGKVWKFPDDKKATAETRKQELRKGEL